MFDFLVTPIDYREGYGKYKKETLFIDRRNGKYRLQYQGGVRKILFVIDFCVPLYYYSSGGNSKIVPK